MPSSRITAGHALGLTSFEDPHLIPSDDTPLESWMVIAVEPGAYVRWPVRRPGGERLRRDAAGRDRAPGRNGGRRVAEAKRLHHTGFTVSDLDRSLAFYRDLLGFEVVMRQEKQGGYLAAIVGYPDAHVRMAHVELPTRTTASSCSSTWPRSRSRAEIEPRTIGPTHVCLIVADLPARLRRRLRQAGVDSFFSPPVEVDTGANAGGLALYLRDPDGIILELFQPPAA